MKRQFLYGTLFSILFIACGKKADDSKTPLPEVELESFRRVYSKNCFCYLANDADQFKTQDYIYGNTGDTAYVSIKGTQTKLLLIKSETSGTHTVKQFANDSYELRVDVRKIGSDKKPHQIGILTISRKGEKGSSRKVYGECGC